MTTYYVGPGGNDANDGLTWAARKLTLNGAEDIPVAAGDTVYVGPGTYRETLTCDVDGASGSPITYIGDYTGASTDGTGGLVRITGSDNDIATARNNAINVNAKPYRTFNGFLCNGCAQGVILGVGSNCIIERMYIQTNYQNSGIANTANTTGITIRNCFIHCGDGANSVAIYLLGSSAYNANSTIENCIVLGGQFQYYGNYAGGLTFKNCMALHAGGQCFRFLNQHADYPSTITNCIIYGDKGIYCNAASIVTEDYNNFITTTARENVAVGANSNTHIIMFDTRWFFEMINGGTLLTPFDLASYAGLVDVAGTSPTTADMRGTTVQGTQREWGALEYDSTLDIEAGSGGGGTTIRNVVIPMFIRRR
jgi:hypothetical protein